MKSGIPETKTRVFWIAFSVDSSKGIFRGSTHPDIKRMSQFMDHVVDLSEGGIDLGHGGKLDLIWKAMGVKKNNRTQFSFVRFFLELCQEISLDFQNPMLER